MKFSERWRLAGVIATEVRFKGYLETNPTNLSRVKENPERIARQIRSSSRITALLSGVLVITLAAITIGMVGFDTAIGNPDVRMALGFGLFLLFSFVILFFLNLTTTTGFFVSGAMRLPSSLPLSKKELENLSILSFARVFIAPAAFLVTIYPTASLIIFGPLAALIALVGCAATVCISIGALLRFAKWYHRKTHSADESRMSTVVRLAATFGLVLGFVSVYMISSVMYEVVQIVVAIAASVGPSAYTVLAMIFPFSFGFLSSTATYGISFNIEAVLLGIVATSVYSLIAIRSFQSAGASLREVSLGGATEGRIGLLRDIAIEVTSPLKALIRKDIKLATKNIGSAFVFVMPFFLLIMIYPMIAFWGGGVRSMTALVAIEYANLFGGISLVSILMFDSQGASIQEGLPQSTRLTLRAKVGIAYPIYIVSLTLITIILALQQLITPLVLLIPVAQVPAGYGIATLSGGVIYNLQGGGRAVAISFTGNTSLVFIAGIVGGLLGIIPLVGYGLVMILTGMHILCLLVQGGLSLLVALFCNRYVTRLLKD